MGQTLENNLSENAKAERERMWLTRLRNMPPGVFDLIVKRIVRGDPLRHIAQHLHTIKPDLSEETFRKWLQVLAKLVREETAGRETLDQTLKAIDDFNKAKAAGSFAGVEPPPVPTSAGSLNRLKANVDKAILELDSEHMLKYAWVIQQKRVDKMVDQEEKLDCLLPRGNREIETLLAIAEAIMNHEMGSARKRQAMSDVAADGDRTKHSTPKVVQTFRGMGGIKPAPRTTKARKATPSKAMGATELQMDCEECDRRETRYKIAMFDLEHAPNESARRLTELYLDEVVTSHPEHPRKGWS